MKAGRSSLFEQIARSSALPEGPGTNRSRPRNRIEHAQVVDPADIPRFARLGVIASMQPNHLLTDMNWAEDRLGPQRAAYSYAWKAFLDAGVPLAFGTDYPVEPITPFRGLYAAVTRMNEAGTKSYFPENKLTRGQALYAYTQGSAYAEFAEKHKGKLAPGYDADFILVDRDLYTADAPAILNTKVLETFVAGKKSSPAARRPTNLLRRRRKVIPADIMPEMKLRAYLLMLFTVAVWGSTFVVIKGALAEATPAAFNLARMTLAFLVLAVGLSPLVARYPRMAGRGRRAGGTLSGHRIPVPDHRPGLHHPFQVGFHHRTRGRPCATVFLNSWLAPSRRPSAALERLSRRRAGLHRHPAYRTRARSGPRASLLPDLSSINIGDILTLGCAVGFAFHCLALSHISPRIGFRPLALLQVGFCAVFMALSLPLIEHPHIAWTPRSVIALAIAAVLATAAAFSIQSWAQSVLPPTHTALLLTMEPVFAWITSFLVLGERLGPRPAGRLLILAGIALTELVPQPHVPTAHEA